MKIAWFTPFNVESAIGRYSKFAAEALSAYADVDIFISKVAHTHKTKCQVVKFTQDNVGELLKKYDLAVYNIGDNFVYHAEIYDVAQMYPGVIVNHDVCLHNFMRGYYLEHKKDYYKFKLKLEEEFGLEDAEMLWKVAMRPEEYSKVDFLKYNFSKHVADNAFGVIVHSKYHESYFKHYYKGSLTIIPHLNTNEGLDKLDSNITFSNYKSGKKHILTVGNLNENKRIHSIIRVLGECPELAKKIDYTIVGEKGNKTYCGYLNELIHTYSLEDSVNITGFVSHKELAYYYQGADIISNLRYPAYEGASGSIVEQLAIGKCCMVSNTGVYAEIDNDCVIKVSPENEISEIKDIFEKVLNESMNIDKIGKNAKKYAEKELDRHLYAQKVFEFLENIIFQRPMHVTKDKCLSTMEDMPTVLQTKFPLRLAGILSELYENNIKNN